jgi:hypothetical protein
MKCVFSFIAMSAVLLASCATGGTETPADGSSDNHVGRRSERAARGAP